MSNLPYFKLYTQVLNELGPNCAVIHAIIANSSQDDFHCCELSLTSLGNLAHLNYRSVSGAIDTLLDKKIKIDEYGDKYFEFGENCLYH